MPEQSPEIEQQDELEPSAFDKFLFFAASAGTAGTAAEGIGHYQPVIAVVGTLALYKLSVYGYTKLANRPFSEDTSENH